MAPSPTALASRHVSGLSVGGTSPSSYSQRGRAYTSPNPTHVTHRSGVSSFSMGSGSVPFPSPSRNIPLAGGSGTYSVTTGSDRTNHLRTTYACVPQVGSLSIQSSAGGCSLQLSAAPDQRLVSSTQSSVGGCSLQLSAAPDQRSVGGYSLQLSAAPDQRLVSSRKLSDLSKRPVIVKTKTAAERISSAPRAARVTSAAPKRKASSLLSRCTRDLTQAAADGALDPLVGRASELDRMTQILARRQKNNPVLIGDPGVGKTAVVEGLAQKIVADDVPEVLMKKRILQLDIASILAGASARGEFEKRFKDVLQEVVDANGDTILFIDELHTLVGTGRAGKGDSVVDASNIIKPILARGEVQCIGVTSLEEYRAHIEKDKALERRFQPILVSEPSIEDTIQILRALSKNYEAHHKVKYTEAAMVACAKASAQYITDRYLPDKAIDVFDESGSRVRLRWLRQEKSTGKLDRLQKQLDEVRTAKEVAVRAEDYTLAAEIKEMEVALQQQLKCPETSGLADNEDTSTAEGSSSFDEGDGSHWAVVTEDDIAQTISEWTGVPLEKISAAESVQLVGLEATLHKRVIGQDEAVAAIAKAVRRSRAGLRNPSRPIASFMFCGPTGVGKTELCKALASAYFGLEDAMLRLDMSEFMESHSVAKLIGSPAGYIGYGDENQLTDRIRRKPYSLVLLDEVEKAHPDVLNLALQLLEDGRLTDSKGRVVSFKNALIIMTSNIGSAAIEQEVSRGVDSTYADLKAVAFAQLSKAFLPEFLNRLDEVIAFKSLTKSEVAQIADIEFQKVKERVKEKKINLDVSEAFKMKCVDEGFSVAYGARPLRRAIVRLLEDELAESLLKHAPCDGERVLMDVDDDGTVTIHRPDMREAEVASCSAEESMHPQVDGLSDEGKNRDDEIECEAAFSKAHASTFTIELQRRSSDEQLGLDLTVGMSLQVAAIFPAGIAQRYNDGVNFERQIREGDYIIAVNDIQYDSKAMTQELIDASKLTIIIQRPSVQAINVGDRVVVEYQNKCYRGTLRQGFDNDTHPGMYMVQCDDDKEGYLKPSINVKLEAAREVDPSSEIDGSVSAFAEVKAANVHAAAQLQKSRSAENDFCMEEVDDSSSASKKLSNISAKIDAMLRRAEAAQKSHEEASERRMQQLRADLALPGR